MIYNIYDNRQQGQRLILLSPLASRLSPLASRLMSILHLRHVCRIHASCLIHTVVLKQAVGPAILLSHQPLVRVEGVAGTMSVLHTFILRIHFISHIPCCISHIIFSSHITCNFHVISHQHSIKIARVISHHDMLHHVISHQHDMLHHVISHVTSCHITS